MNQLSFILLACALIGSASSARVFYKQCDPKWVAKFFANPSHCNNPNAPYTPDRTGEVLALLSDFLTWNNIPCLGISPCTPGVLINLPNLKKLRNRQLGDALGLFIGDESTD